MRNEHRLNCDDAVWLASKDMDGSFRLLIKVSVTGTCKVCDLSLLTRVIYERFEDDFIRFIHTFPVNFMHTAILFVH